MGMVPFTQIIKQGENYSKNIQYAAKVLDTFKIYCLLGGVKMFLLFYYEKDISGRQLGEV
jgi:hypothetical protein